MRVHISSGEQSNFDGSGSFIQVHFGADWVMGKTITGFDLEVLGHAARRSVAYLQGVTTRRVAPAASAVADLAQFDEPFPDAPGDPYCVLDLLDRVGSPATVATAGGRFFGFVNGAALPASVAATWLASAWDQNAALRVMSPAGGGDRRCGARAGFGTFCGSRRTPGGAVVTGATMANFTGLAAARHALLARAGWDVENDGLFRAPQLTVVVGDEVHISLLKALGMLGLGRKRVIRVPVDEQGRMIAAQLPPLDDRTIVCIQAGNVNTRRVRPGGGDLPAGTRGARVGPRGWRIRPVGRRFPALPAPDGGLRTGGLLGGRRSQVAERWIRLWSRDGARRGGAEGSHGHRGSVSAAGRAAGAVALHAGDVAAGARRGTVGHAAVAGPERAGGSDRADLRPCAALRRGAARGGT